MLTSLKTTVSVLHWVWTHPANQHRRVRQVVRALSFQVRGRLMRRPTVTPLGKRSRIAAELHVTSSSRAVYANPPDVPAMYTWQQWLRSGDLFIDVGANVGLYTILAAELGADVIAVEPDPSAIARLRKNLDLNGYRATVVQAALADESGTREFTVGRDSTNRLVAAPQANSHPVEAKTLDALIGRKTARGVKIDVEGAEWQVLRGAERALREGRIELLQLEWNDCSWQNFGYDRAQLAAWLRERHYELLEATCDGTLKPLATISQEDVFARPVRRLSS
jgi:FkbM family methyltransferase